MNRILILAALLLTPFSSVAGDEDEAGKAIIVTGMARPVSCIAPVAIHEIDGKNVQVHPQRFELEAGEHSMKGTAAVNLDYCPKGRTAEGRRILKRGRIEPLQGYFEAGLQYYVGFDHSAEDPENWGYTVWKIENAQGKVVRDDTTDAEAEE